MKKFLILFLALTFVLSLGTFVFADDRGAGVADNGSFTISGDMRVRGIAQTNYNLNDDADADDHFWDQRLRVKLTGMVGNGIEVRSRINVGMDEWDNNSIRVDTATHTDPAGPAPAATPSTSNGGVSLDYAYLHIPVGNYVIDAGVKTRNWGNKLALNLWDAEYEGVEVSTDIGAMKLGLFTDKLDDSRAVGGNDENLEDNDNYGIYGVYSADNMEAGLLIRQTQNDIPSGAGAAAVDDQDGLVIDAYLNTTVGAVSIAAEIAQYSDDIYEDSSGDDPLGAFIYASTDIGAINVNLFVATMKDGFVADNDLAPTVFFGTAHPLAIGDVQAADTYTTNAIALGVGTDINSDLSVTAKLAYFDLEGLAPLFGGVGPAAPDNALDESATEIDLGLAYKLSDNATYYIDFGYFMPDEITANDDDAMALGHKIQVYF